MTEVRNTVDEKIISNMAGSDNKNEVKQEISEPVKDEVKDEVKSESNEYLNEEETKADNKEVKSEKDEYGNDVAPKKTYTEDEVNELMRQRFNRTKKEESVKHEVKPQEQQEGQDENWEAQLENFVESTVKKISQKERDKLREVKEQESMGKLEMNIHQSMGKYKDFKEVVGKVPMSDYMVKATKNFKDPGAFIYAASKTQSKELERIAQLDDPLDQAAEIGKLEERMRKMRAGTNSPRPVSQVKGDVENKSYIRPSVDDLVRKDAMKKLGNRRY